MSISTIQWHGLTATTLACSAFVLAFTLAQPEMNGHMPLATSKNEDDPEARLRYEWLMLRDPATGQIPAEIRKQEIEFAAQLPKREEGEAFAKGHSGHSATWVSRGPWNVGGRTRALGIDIADPNIIVAGGVSGGIWRSVNGGSTWTKTSTPGSLHSSTCLAQDTRTGQRDVWYFGTGENIGNSGTGGGSPFVGNGIFKSVDNGNSWTQLASTSGGDPQSFDLFFDYVWNVAVHPANGAVYAAAWGTIFRSTDGGTNWTVMLGGPSSAPYSPMTDVQIAANGTVYTAASWGDPTIQGFSRSTDNGASWSDITPNDLPTTTRRIVIGVAPSNSNVVYFLAETPGNGSNGHSLWKYNAAGNSYQNLSANLPATGGLTGNFDSQGSYDLVIRVKPDNENAVIIGGTNLFISTNGFSSVAATNWIGGYTPANTTYQAYPNHHPDQHSLVFAPNNSSILYSGHDGGITRTNNVLATSVVWQSLSNGYLTTQFYTVALDHATVGDADILGGTQDNGCWGIQSASGTAPWEMHNGGDGAFTAIANGRTSLYVSSQNGNTIRLFGANQFARVDPGGTGYLFINPFVLDPNNSNLMYMGRSNQLLRNSDLTQIPAGSFNPSTVNWTVLATNTTNTQSQASAIGVATTNPPDRVYVAFSTSATAASTVVRIDNANTGSPAFTNVYSGSFPQTGYVACVAVDPTDGNRALIVFSNYSVTSLFITTNGGTAWTNVEGNLAGANGPSCRYAVIVPSGGGTIYYLGTSTGLYSTTALQGGATVWTQEGATTIGNVIVPFLDARHTDGTVVVGTHANGVYSTSGGGGQTTTVYSGDANNDAVCDIRDILPIGRFFGSTGPARPGGSTTWNAQTATLWGNPDATYADCDGNGTVDAGDVQGIIANYGQTQAPAGSPVDPLVACTAILRAIDEQDVHSHAMMEIRREVIEYMKNNLGITLSYDLAQNYPNPFNPSTTLRFTVPEHTAHADLTVYDLNGRVVWSTSLEDLPTGGHETVWNGKSNEGLAAASGIYICRFRAGSFSASRRMLLVK